MPRSKYFSIRRLYLWISAAVVVATIVLLIVGVTTPEAASAVGGLLLVGATIIYRLPVRLRIMVLMVAVVLFAAAGVFDFAIWDAERAKPSPHYLGPPR